MNSWVPKTNIVIVAVALLCLSALVYGGALFVINKKVASIELAYSNTANTLALEEEARTLKVVADENYEKIDFVNKYFVEKGDELVFIEDIESVAKNLNIKFSIASITPVKPSSEGGESKEISVKMNMEGSWNSIASFVDRIEKLSFGVLVQNFSIDKQSGGVWGGSIEFLVFN